MRGDATVTEEGIARCIKVLRHELEYDIILENVSANIILEND